MWRRMVVWLGLSDDVAASVRNAKRRVAAWRAAVSRERAARRLPRARSVPLERAARDERAGR
jgi:hypothetical protein